MIRLTTLTKLRIARLLSKLAIGSRRLCGCGQSGVFQRGGLSWKLDLTEGIDLSIYLFGKFEREVYRAYRRLLAPGSVVLDIGANIGAHTLPLAKLCGEQGAVHAFEPTLFAFQKLEENLALNPNLKQRVFLHHALLTDKSDQLAPDSIPSSWQLGNREAGETHPQHGGSYKTIGSATVMTVDHFVNEQSLPQIDLIKLDVDGNEWPVLQGAKHTIERFRPTILMEFSLDYDRDSFSEILAFLHDLDYSAKRLVGHGTLPLELEPLRAYIPLNGSINVQLDG